LKVPLPVLPGSAYTVVLVGVVEFTGATAMVWKVKFVLSAVLAA